MGFWYRLIFALVFATINVFCYLILFAVAILAFAMALSFGRYIRFGEMLHGAVSAYNHEVDKIKQEAWNEALAKRKK